METGEPLVGRVQPCPSPASRAVVESDIEAAWKPCEKQAARHESRPLPEIRLAACSAAVAGRRVAITTCAGSAGAGAARRRRAFRLASRGRPVSTPRASRREAYPFGQPCRQRPRPRRSRRMRAQAQGRPPRRLAARRPPRRPKPPVPRRCGARSSNSHRHGFGRYPRRRSR